MVNPNKKDAAYRHVRQTSIAKFAQGLGCPQQAKRTTMTVREIVVKCGKDIPFHCLPACPKVDFQLAEKIKFRYTFRSEWRNLHGKEKAPSRTLL